MISNASFSDAENFDLEREGCQMSFPNMIRRLLDRRGLRFILVPLVSHRARSKGKDVKKVFYDRGLWIHETPRGYFVYHEPFVRLDMSEIDELARMHFLWGYKPRKGDVVMDVGAGVGEEALTFSREVGERGKVICIEAHPRTYRCLEQLVEYNRLGNVIAIHCAVTEPARLTATIEDSDDYLSNRLSSSTGISVAARTIDAIHQKLSLGRVNFLKMNIEGAERLAVSGMTETLRHTEVLCVSCHDFLADATGDESLRAKSWVKEFLKQSGLKVVERLEQGLPPYVADQVWAYNEVLMKGATS